MGAAMADPYGAPIQHADTGPYRDLSTTGWQILCAQRRDRPA